MEIRVIDLTSGSWSSAPVRSDLGAEEVTVALLRNRVNVSPVGTPLFGLRSAKGLWLAPNQNLNDLGKN